MRVFNVMNYGARPGDFDSTGAIQGAIDACGAAGGGKVEIPAGTFSTDMLTLRDNVELHLDSGCVLLSLLEPLPEDDVEYREASFNMKRWLVGGWGISNASITGKGTMDGRGYVRFWNKNDGYEHPLYGQRYWPSLHRPRALLHFRSCTDITIRDVTLLDPPAYNIWMSGCHRCDIVDIRIRTDERGPNNDGIDIDCCSNICIRGCDIITNDDAIGIFSDINTLGEDKPCENIIVSDCRIKAISDGIRIGYVGDGIIRNVTISNCVIYDSMIGISMMEAISPGDPRGVYIKYGPRITDINFSDLIIDAQQAFNFQSTKSPATCPEPIKGYMDRIYLRNITARAKRGCYFGGVPESPLRTIEISQLNLVLSGEMGSDFQQRVPEPYPVWTDMPFDGLPWPFFVRYADDFTLRDSSIRWENATGRWQPEPVKAEYSTVHVKDLRCVNQPVQSPAPPEFPVESGGEYSFFKDFAPEKSCSACGKLAFLRGHSMYSSCKADFDPGTVDWKEYISGLEASGVTTLLWEYSVCRELYKRFYPSSRYSDMRVSCILPGFLKAAAESSCKVYVGTYASTVLWRQELSEAALEKEIIEQKCCISELVKQGRADGYFLPLCRPGTAHYPYGDWVERTSRLYCEFVKKVHDSVPGAEAVLPVSVHDIPLPEEEFAAVWCEILKKASCDVLVVYGGNAEIWKLMAERAGCRFIHCLDR